MPFWSLPPPSPQHIEKVPCCNVCFSEGCSGIQVEEIYSLDEASLEDLRYYSLILAIFYKKFFVHVILVNNLCSN